MADTDTVVRLAAFRFLEEQTRLSPETGTLSRTVLANGFNFEGQRVPLMGPQGIFKPRLCDIPISITTVPLVEGKDRPYDDVFGEDGLLRYRYRGSDPAHVDNVGLRRAMQRQIPLIYFHGIVPGLYVAEWPVYVVGDDSSRLSFTVSVEERRFAALGSLQESDETEIRRRYATRLFRQRLHQREFRERVAAERRIRVLEGARVLEVLGRGRVEGLRLGQASGETRLACEAVVIKVGVVPATEWCRGVLAHDEAGYLRVDGSFATPAAGVWAAGDVVRPAVLSVAVAIGQGALAAASIRNAIRG